MWVYGSREPIKKRGGGVAEGGKQPKNNGIQLEIKETTFDSNGHVHFNFKAQTLNNWKMNKSI